MNLLRRFGEDQSGNVIMLAAGGLAVVLGIATLAVDIGGFYYTGRRAQGAADLAALAAAQDLGHSAEVAAATVAANNIALTAPLDVELGTYRADPTVLPAARFSSGVAGTANAVRVSLHTDSTLFFGRALGFGDVLQVDAAATATQAAFASFAIGSRLLGVDGGLLNSILGKALGMDLSLSVMDYSALADAEVDLPKFLSSVATRAHLTAGTYDRVLASTVDEPDAIAAVADAVANKADGAVAGALDTLVGAASASTKKLGLAGLIDLGPYGDLPVGQQPGAGVSVSALDLLSAMAQISGGGNQVALALDTGLPGIASASLQIAIGERPQGTSWVTVGSEGASVHTAQTRLLLTIDLLGSGSVSLIHLPIYLEIGSATATLSKLACAWPDATQSTASLDVTPAVVDAWIGAVTPAEMQNFSRTPDPGPQVLLSLGLITVTGQAHVALTNVAPRAVDFSYDDIAAQTKRTVGTTDFSTLLTSLLGNLRIGVTAGGLNLPLALGPQVSGLVASAAPAIDALVGGVLATLGVGVGQADVWLTGIRCDGAVLVN